MEPTMEKDEATGRSPAGFSDRVVAFSIDIGLFVLAHFMSLKIVFPAESPFDNPYGGLWVSLWSALFLLYQAYFSCEGRRSLGKALLGLRIVDLEGEPLGLGKAVIRSAAYLVSSVLNLGFLWSLFNPSRQCWHDMAAGSLVVEDQPKSAGLRVLVRAGAVACMAIVAGSWYWNNIWALRHRGDMAVAAARAGVKELATLQQLYHFQNGRYADSILDLAPLSGAPRLFLADMANVLDVDSGITIKSTDKNFSIAARATDENRTLIAFNGP